MLLENKIASHVLEHPLLFCSFCILVSQMQPISILKKPALLSFAGSDNRGLSFCVSYTLLRYVNISANSIGAQ